VTELEAVELKAHIPAKDFEASKKFYQDVGFTLCWSTDSLALLHYGPHGVHGVPSFLLQNHYVKELADNLQMHLLVKNVDAWWVQLQTKRIPQAYGVEVGAPEDREWRMRDFTLADPSGVLWRIAQSIDEPANSQRAT
jgi:catechol 2,3-dioxygenase-like lactoylglutathione lyase family enzyme